MGKDKLMRIPVIIDKKKSKQHIFDFFTNFKNFNFYFNNFKDTNIINDKNILVFILNDTKSKQLKIIEKQIKNYNKNFNFFLPLSLKNEITINEFTKIIYPITINNFEKKILSLFKTTNLNFENLYLNNENMLENIHNNASIYLTELEASILKIFFINNKVSKDDLKIKALNLRPDIESKTLEAHVYRLRKKLYKICNNISIINLNKKYLTITNINSKADLQD